MEYDIPTICVGNLSVGGTGKTPMIEYLIRLLEKDYKIATLSRGYKRSSDGFVLADRHATAVTIGDEPFQFYNKFPNILVSVDSNRRNGISKLRARKDPPKVILLDDAFQHRRIKAKFNILLTPYDDLYIYDMPLPTGNLREPKSGAKRADVIVVTKCPESISETDKKRLRKSLKIDPKQHLFFSWICYEDRIKNAIEEAPLERLRDKKITLVTGIANPKPFLDYLMSKNLRFEHLNFPDHHNFTSKEIKELQERELILTTEKDFMRLSPHFANNTHLYYLPIEMKMDRPEAFGNVVKSKLIPKA